MSIEKYLDNIKFQDIHPGPFAVRLKHEMKSHFFYNRNRSLFFPALSASFGLLMFIFTTGLIIRPDVASKIHYAFNRAEKRQMEIEFSNEGHLLGSYRQENSISSNNIHYTSSINDIPNLDENKTYLIKRLRDENNRFFYFIKEVKESNQRRTVY